MQIERFIAVLRGIFVISLAVFGHSSASDQCRLTPLEKRLHRAVSKLQTTPIWRDFPSQYIFAVREFEAKTNGFFVLAGEDQKKTIDAKLGVSCGPSLVRSAEPLTALRGNFYPSCSETVRTEGCLEIPIFEKLFAVLKRPVGIIGLEKEKIEKLNLMTSPGLMTHLQIGIYHPIHEMFHEYQVERKWNLSTPVHPEECRKHPLGLASYEIELQWWQKNISAIHKARRDPVRLLAILKEFYATIRPVQESTCQTTQIRIENQEGVAHFVGMLATLRTGLMSPQDIARVDRAFLKVPFEVHSAMQAYATGGSLSWLLYYLMGEGFIDQVEQGLTPYEIGIGLNANRKGTRYR